MARITNITVAGPDDPIYTGRWVISKQGPPEQNKEDDMAIIKTILVDSPEKMPNQNSRYSIIIPQVKDTVPLSEQKHDKEEPHSESKKSE